jgi:excisionase family DNA binding protein
VARSTGSPRRGGFQPVQGDRGRPELSTLVEEGDDIMERLLSVKEAAERLSCSPAAVRKWLYQRRLPRVKVGRLTRVRPRDLDAFVAQGADRHLHTTGAGHAE